MARTTRIIEGARSPAELERLASEITREAQERHILAASAPAPQPTPRRKYEFPVRFQFAAQNYLILLDHPQELADGTIKHNKFTVRAENGYLDITTKKYPVATRIVSELLTKASGYGLGRSFWDADEAEAALAEAQRKQTIDRVKLAKADPDLRAALLAELQADDFDLKTAEQ